MKLYTPVVEQLKLQIRMNPRGRAVDIRTSESTPDVAALQKAEDFIKAFIYGFEIDVRW
jgi:RNA-binding protein PNO1